MSVEKTVQKNNNIVASNGVGLTNINNKFKLLNQKGISIIESNDSFQDIDPPDQYYRSSTQNRSF